MYPASKVRFLPAVTCAWLVLTVLVSYSIATALQHVLPLWPYISDTGTKPPESCIFGAMLSVTSVLLGSVLFIRYKQVCVLSKLCDNGKLVNLLNLVCLATGAVAAVGAFLVAHFQETSVISVHLIGANMCFGVGTGYCVVQTAICFMLCDDRLTRKLNVARCVFCSVNVVTFACTLVFGKLSFAEYTGDPLLWAAGEPGFDYRLASTFSEWLLALSFGLYIATFTHEFRNVSCTVKLDVSAI